jgi:hypothetical protein
LLPPGGRAPHRKSAEALHFSGGSVTLTCVGDVPTPLEALGQKGLLDIG